MTWGFYGRQRELTELRHIFSRSRWFFAKVSGRRRIGKTSLIRQVSLGFPEKKIFYVQLPDSGPAGVLSAVDDALKMLGLDSRFARPKTLLELARLIGLMARQGLIVAIDEFQYFSRDRLRDFCSHLQHEVDILAADAANVPGGLLVLGSIHTEMSALLEDRGAPLFNRLTDNIELSHLDVASLNELLTEHADNDPARFLFLWTLFEGVPKFYRDCYEQGVLASDRRSLLSKMFFLSSSPLRNEAENWFLRELHGRYDVVLKFVARNPGCSHGDIVSFVNTVAPERKEQIGGHLKVLIDKYGLIERKDPVFSAAKTRRGKYYIADNFLRSWLGALGSAVSAMHFAPVDSLIAQADQKLEILEGRSLEKLVGQLYEERSRKGVGDFNLSSRIQGYWDRAGVEIDLVAIDEPGKRLRFGTCKRAETRILSDIPQFDKHIAAFLSAFPGYNDWRIERVAFAPLISGQTRTALIERGLLVEDLGVLIAGLI